MTGKLPSESPARPAQRLLISRNIPAALPNTDSYIKLIDALVSRLAAALK